MTPAAEKCIEMIKTDYHY